MKLITRFELATRRTEEILSLHAHFTAAFAKCKPHSAEARTCLASLQNLEDEINSRLSP